MDNVVVGKKWRRICENDVLLMLAAANGKRSQQPLLGTGCINKKVRAFPPFPEESGTDPLLLHNRFLLIALSFCLTS
jgi:hypothetical protein